ncbi:N-acetylmuramoyl-L-alanine amidase LytC precursor [Caloramator mitchellensis]|uniref:N-acetylmuramoyl-L-alanine amidase LytC n=1 Tax=Caloramator mitchellensis TaxID=908809 RepID=A0A0R3K259_CALMK|nr:N-acetylmuramoyl-L-alanine amidase [Caloramator mitchellensis]KRQ87356.1 N-acetylmuramoyl-L-alanine amidase LytC precursor [Caloramator mitchellensis]
MKFKIWIVSVILLITFNINIVFAGVLTGKKIVIDPGHGGSDPGAVAGNVREKDLNNSFARKIAELLTAYGAEVLFTRLPEEDVYVALQDRTSKSNSINPDLFISIHNNANTNTTVSGVETFYSTSRPYITDDRYVEYLGNKYQYVREEIIDGAEYVYFIVDRQEVKLEKSKVSIILSKTPWQAIESKKIAETIVNNLASLGFKNRGAKDSNLYVTKYTNTPSVLLELGFITNPEERQKLLDPTMQSSISTKVVESILKYYEQYDNNKRLAFAQVKDFDFNLSKEFAFVGQAVDITVSAMSNIELYDFKLQIKRMGEILSDSGFSNNLTYNFVPDREGEYEAILYIKYQGSNNEYEKFISKKINVYQPAAIKNISLTTDKAIVGNKVSLNVEKLNGSVLGCEYTFDIFKEEKLIQSKKSDSNIFEFTPTEDGEYKLIVKIKDKLSSNEYDDYKELNFSVQKIETKPSESKIEEPVKPIDTISLLKYTRTLKRGAVGEDVKELQKALIKLGYLKITTPTTKFGPATETAVKAFQKANKLPSLGIVGRATIDKINILLPRVASNTQTPSRGNTTNSQTKIGKLIYTRTLKRGAVGEDVKELQRALIKLGYLKINTPTTKFGPATETAVKAFQKANKLPSLGIVGKATIDKINSILAR